MSSISTSTAASMSVRRVRFWQHGRAVRQMLRAYPPGTDALVDRIRAAGVLTRLLLLRLVLPLYFAREQGWMIRGERGAMAAIMYLRRNTRQGIPVMHIDEINVAAQYRHRGCAQRLMSLAEELARTEQRPYLKLAVTVANTPAVTLYRRLGYQEQHHRHFTFAPPAATLRPATAGDIRLRPLRRRQAVEANRRYYRMELRASVPAVADMMVAYYPRAAGGVGVPKAGERRFAVEKSGQQVGYADAYRRRGQWQLRLSLRPELWGTESERQAILLLTSAVGDTNGARIALHVPSAAHCDALSAGPESLARELGMTQQSYDRMIMAKALATS
jgi:GNAT superfamily N-acetyltransferase